MTTTISFTVAQRIGTLMLAPAFAGKPPTLNHAVLDRLEAVLAQIEAAVNGAELDLLFVCSAVPKYFCVGADVGSLQSIDAKSITPWVLHGHRAFNRLEDLPIPVVARVEGFALGGGLELAMACDVIFAAESARLGQTEAKLGFVAGWGGSWRLPRRIGVAQAKLMFYTGRLVPAAEAHRLGLVEFCGSVAELDAYCQDFTQAVQAGSTVSHAGHKRLLTTISDVTREDGGKAEAKVSTECAGTPSTRQRLADFFATRTKAS